MNRIFCLTCLLLTMSPASGASIIDGNPQKSYILDGFKQLVDQYKIRGTNHFFIYRYKNGNAVIYWREANEIWGVSLDPYFEKPGKTELTVKVIWGVRFLARFKPVCLTEDMIQDNEDAGGSNLPRRSEIASELFDCIANGELLEIYDAPSVVAGLPAYHIYERNRK